MTTVLQLAVVTLTLILMNYGTRQQLHDVPEWATAVVTIASGAQYVMRGLKLVG